MLVCPFWYDHPGFSRILMHAQRLPADRGPKTNGRGTAPNVRAWGARQAAIGLTFTYAFFSAEAAAYTAALIALLTRISGDVIQNLLDGCYWKLGIFLPVEGVACILLFLS